MEKIYIDTDEEEYSNGEVMLDTPARRPALNGLLWIVMALRIFMERWGSWLIISLFIFIVQYIVQFAAEAIKILWGMSLLFSVMVYAGIQCAASEQEYDEERPAIRHLFMPLEGKILEFVILTCSLLVVFVGTWIFFHSTIKNLGLHNVSFEAMSSSDMITLMLLATFCFSVIGFVFWFTPALVFLRDESPFSAIIMSLKAGFKNILPFLLFFIAQWLILAAVTFAMGMTFSTSLVGFIIITVLFVMLYPTFMGLCCYAAYRDIWFEEND